MVLTKCRRSRFLSQRYRVFRIEPKYTMQRVKAQGVSVVTDTIVDKPSEAYLLLKKATIKLCSETK